MHENKPINFNNKSTKPIKLKASSSNNPNVYSSQLYTSNAKRKEINFYSQPKSSNFDFYFKSKDSFIPKEFANTNKTKSSSSSPSNTKNKLFNEFQDISNINSIKHFTSFSDFKKDKYTTLNHANQNILYSKIKNKKENGKNKDNKKTSLIQNKNNFENSSAIENNSSLEVPKMRKRSNSVNYAGPEFGNCPEPTNLPFPTFDNNKELLSKESQNLKKLLHLHL